MKNKKPNSNYYSILPASVRYCKHLQPRAILLYAEITSLTHKEGHCWASNQYFADLYNVSSTTVSKWVAALCENGFVRTEIEKTKYGSARKIFLALDKNVKTPLDENTKTPLDEKPKHNIKSINTKDIKVSKDTCITFKNVSGFEKRCIKIWNSFSFTTTHRSSAIHKTVERYLKQLMKGTFLYDKEWDEKYLERNKTVLNERKYTKSELLRGIRNVALFSKEGYPTIKTKGLANLIYNPRTGVSVFLSVIDSPPKPLKEKRHITDPNPILTKLFLKIYKPNNMNDTVKLYSGIQTLIAYQKLINLRTDKIKRLFGTPKRLCTTYIEWLGEQGWIDKIVLGYISSKGKMFNKFVEEMENECNGYKLVTKLNI
ncbi:MAG: helix-turn-helix domain-containing protein [Gammaproteobacteria bacterium]|nr:helix-turn-helix domain-containing protein [Gammaproteobacteria bacterium]